METQIFNQQQKKKKDKKYEDWLFLNASAWSSVFPSVSMWISLGNTDNKKLYTTDSLDLNGQNQAERSKIVEGLHGLI